jgi:protocatechuate 3,4-dioxygenase beta subunit
MAHDDDHQIGQILSRRQMLALLGAAGAVMLPACGSNGRGSGQPAGTTRPGGPTTAAISAPPTTATAVAMPACVVRPAQSEGPYFVNEMLNRSDIRTDPSDGSVREGTPLRLTFNVGKVSGSSCGVFSGAIVDVWHCDAAGVYSDVRDPRFSTVGKKFLRGYQATDANGRATFTTIYPGWYQGRAVHIHFKIRNHPSDTSGFDFTSQLYFDESVTDQVYAQAPYSRNPGNRVRNTSDGIFRGSGQQMLLTPTRDGQGYAATFDIGVQQ